ncbi:MMPL family transporter [Actinomadura sp. BRA 177]|uniref:MMPL family transporter n=1 Tax=Actinomadura sp. BRA 177 TaxID=2745202 RepID=UPI0034D95255
MIAVFAGFAASPESMIKMMGFALAAGVAFDAFVVRMTIVPAVMALSGRAAWWLPGWLARVVPNVDVEGERLRHLLDDDAGRTPRHVAEPTTQPPTPYAVVWHNTSTHPRQQPRGAAGHPHDGRTDRHPDHERDALALIHNSQTPRRTTITDTLY